jgi:serine-type D-Ala-D-Ala carboxypeptidase
MTISQLSKSPESLGFHAARIRRIAAIVKAGFEEGLYPAASWAVMRHGMVAASGAVGTINPAASTAATTTSNTVFDLASVTKSFTGILVTQCIEEGRVQLMQSLGSVLPEAKGLPTEHLTLRQLASHTSGLPAWKPLYKLPDKSILEEILHTSPEKEPGTHYTYSDLGYILLGTIVTRLLGKPLDVLVRERILQPIGMKTAGYNPPEALYPVIAATGHSRNREGAVIVGQVHDENAHALGGVAGHAGLFASLEDMVRLALSLQYPQMAAHCSIPPILSIAGKHLSQHSLIDASVGSHGIGWFLSPNPYLPPAELLSPRSFGHTGFTGTMFVVDPELDCTMILLTNRVYSPGDGGGVLRIRRLFINAALGSIMS